MPSFAPYRWTGDPFVDTSLRTILALRVHSSLAPTFAEPSLHPTQPEEISIDDLRVLFQALPLDRINSLFKSYMMLFTNNGPLHQSKFSGKGEDGDTLGRRIYRNLLEGWLSCLEEDRRGPHRCDACGQMTQAQFSKDYKKAFVQAGEKEPESQEVNRCWFPLAGTLSSEAQAFSGARFPLRICASCLFALQFLPLGIRLFRGKIALPESSSSELCLNFVRANVDKNLDLFHADKADTPGKGESVHQTILFLLGLFQTLEDEVYKTSLSLWQISNSTQAAECQRTDLPSRVLSFLVRMDKISPDDLRDLLQQDTKHGNLLDAILAPRDFPPLYPSKRSQGTSLRFYRAYQADLLGLPKAYLDLCVAAALLLRALATDRDEKFLAKSDASEKKNLLEYTSILRRVLKDATRQGLWSAPLQATLFAFDLSAFPVRSFLSSAEISKRIHFFYQKTQVEPFDHEALHEDSLSPQASKTDLLAAARTLCRHALSALAPETENADSPPRPSNTPLSLFEQRLPSTRWHDSPVASALDGLASLFRLRFADRLDAEIAAWSRSKTGFLPLSSLQGIFLWPDLRNPLLPEYWHAWLWEPSEERLWPWPFLELLTILLHHPPASLPPPETFLRSWCPGDALLGLQALDDQGLQPLLTFARLFLRRFLSRRGHLGSFERENLRPLRTKKTRLSASFVEMWLERFQESTAGEEEESTLPTKDAILGLSEDPKEIFARLSFLLLALSCFYRVQRRKEIEIPWGQAPSTEEHEPESLASDLSTTLPFPSASPFSDDAELY